MQTNSRLFIAGYLYLFLLFFCASIGSATETKDRWQDDDYANWRNKPQEHFKDGAAMFDSVKQTLLKKYVDQGLKEEDLYRAAVQGMLANIDADRSAWNRLMTPTEYAELRSDINGKIVGIGLQFNFNEANGNADILAVVPHTPGAKAGIAPGDQILKVDGKSFKGKQMRDLVYAIRGKAGSSLNLTVLHEDTIRTVKLTREDLVWDTVEAKMLEDGIGLITIHYFTETTPALLKKSLAALKSKGLKGLIVDLRGNEGGVFERAIDSIRQFVPNEKLIVRVQKRGNQQENISGNSESLVKDLPLAVLINGETKSGAEIMAAALQMSAEATAIGSPSFGKWSAQRVEELPNKFAIKYTTATFLAPNGEDLSGKGVNPDIAVDNPEEQLEAAVSVLKLKG